MKHSATYAALIGSTALCLLLLCATGCTQRKNTPTPTTETDTMAQPRTLHTDTTATRRASSTESQLDPGAKGGQLGTQEQQVSTFYDKGYKQGYDDGFEDGIENTRFESYDDACKVSTYSKQLDYKNGYQEGYDAGYDDGFADSDITPDDDLEE